MLSIRSRGGGKRANIPGILSRQLERKHQNKFGQVWPVNVLPHAAMEINTFADMRTGFTRKNVETQTLHGK